MSTSLLGPIRLAIIGDDALAEGVPDVHRGLAVWKNQPACFTRRPIPREVEYPHAIINPPIDIGDQDTLSAAVDGAGNKGSGFREVQTYRIGFYGKKADPGTAADQTRDVEALAHRAHELFHRNKWAVQGEGFRIIDSVASGPIAGPTDDDETVGRIVTLRLRLGRT